MNRAFETLAPANTRYTLIEPKGPLQQDQLWDLVTLPFVAKNPKDFRVLLLEVV